MPSTRWAVGLICTLALAGCSSSDVGSGELSGVVEVVSGSELDQFAAAPVSPPTRWHDQDHTIIRLDSATDITGKHGDAEATETASAIVVGDGDLAQDLPGLHDGQHISFSLDGAECVFASDTSLPTGVPRCRAIAIVNPN